MRRIPYFLCLGLLLTGCPSEKEDTGPVDTDIVTGDADGDGYGADTDCNDSDAAIHPGATEVCDGVDQDCNSEVDEGLLLTFFEDADVDTFGNPDSTHQSCTQESGWVADNTDCDDTSAAVNPSQSEICDYLDNNCNEAVDEGMDIGPWYPDGDADGYGDTAGATESCEPPKGSVDVGGDCDDANSNAWPDATEVCDGVDNDCDLAIDEADAVGAGHWYRDGDTDGYGDASRSQIACDAPVGYVLDDTDCDDALANVNPGATEVCDSADTDEDCDGLADDLDKSVDPASMPGWYTDSDRDGYGDPALLVSTQCDGTLGTVADNTDCDDTDRNLNPAVPELCDGIDQNCDGVVDENPTDGSTWYFDADADGYGDDSTFLTACTAPSGYIAMGGDCDDADATINPGAGNCADTGDTGGGGARDGTYAGTGYLIVNVPLISATDRCDFPLSVTVDEGRSPMIRANATCTFTGTLKFLGAAAAIVTGDITTDPYTEGTIAVGVTFSGPWTGEFVDANTLYGAYTGAVSMKGIPIDYEGEFTVVR